MSDHEPSQGNLAGMPANAAPVTGAERIGSLDVLRGVAILGILVMNIYAFAMPVPAYAGSSLEWPQITDWSRRRL